jgi:hypothetical protein
MASNLPEADHRVVLENLGSGPNGYLDLDYALITTDTQPTSATDPSQESSSSFPTPPGTGTHSSPIAGIVGGVIGGLLLLAGLIGITLLIRRKRRPSHKTGKVNLEIEMGAVLRERLDFTLIATRVEHDLPPPNYDLVFPTESELALNSAQPRKVRASQPLPSMSHSPHVTMPVKR